MKGNNPSLLGPLKPRPPYRILQIQLTLQKLLSVTAWVLCFERHSRQQRRSPGELGDSELTEARTYWIREVAEELLWARASDSSKELPPTELITGSTLQFLLGGRSFTHRRNTPVPLSVKKTDLPHSAS